MPANFEGRETLHHKDAKDSSHGDYSFIGLVDQSESEIRWVKLHQMFDR